MYISIIYSSICVCLLNTLCIQMHILWSYNSMDSSPIYYDITDPPTAQLRICQPSTSRWWSRNVSTHLKKKSKGEPSPKQRWTNHFATRWLQHTNGEKMRYRKKNPEKKNSTSNSNPKKSLLPFLGTICFKELSCSSRDISSSTLWRSSHWALAIKTSSLAWAKFVRPQLVENNWLFRGEATLKNGKGTT